jgi:ATP-dependent Clp protease adaptor protein ClpS
LAELLPEKFFMTRDRLTLPHLGVKPEEVVRHRTQLLPPYKVILFDDDENEMNYVIFALIHAVTNLTAQEAERIMLTAHLTGRAIVIVCPKEVAEYYQERILSYGLIATIEAE